MDPSRGSQADQWNQKPGVVADFAESSDQLDQGSEQIGADAELQRNLERVAAQEAWLDAGNSKGIDLNVVGEGIAELTDHALPLPIGGASTTNQSRTLVVVDSRVGNWGELAESITANADLLLLDANRSGIQQVVDTAIAAERRGERYGVVALVGNKTNEGSVQLGQDVLESDGSGPDNQRLAQLEAETLSSARFRLFSDAPTNNSAQQLRATVSKNGVNTVIGADASEALVKAKQTLSQASTLR